MSQIYSLMVLFLGLQLCFGAELTPISSLPGLSRPSRLNSGRRVLESETDSVFELVKEISLGDGAYLDKFIQYYQGIKVDGIHTVERVVDDEVVDMTGMVLTHIEDDIPSVHDVHLADLDILMQPHDCEEVKYEEVIEFQNGIAILVYKVDCWTAFDSEVDGIHRWRIEFDAQTGEQLSMYDSVDHHLPKNAARRKLKLQDIEEILKSHDLIDFAELIEPYNCDEIQKDTVSMINDLSIIYVADCKTESNFWRLEFDAKSGELISKHDLNMKGRRNLLDTMTAYGGNERTGQLTHNIKVLNNGDGTCTYSTDHVDVVHNQFTQNRQLTTPYTFPCSDLPEQTDAINGAYSPLNDASAYGEVVYNMYDQWYNMEALPFKLSMKVHYGNNWENAMWDGSAMYFGDGQNHFHPLVSLGVTAHEVSHGVTQFASDLIYENQSGGLNEAFSDMSSAAAEFFYWGETEYEMGSKIAKSGAMRWMCDPTRDGRSIDHINSYRHGMDVHYSSGVYNKVFCELSQKDNWGPRKTFELFLIANEIFWEKSTDFQEGADLTMTAVTALNYEATDVCDAFSVVGIIPADCSYIPTPAPVVTPTPACDGGSWKTLSLHTSEWASEISWSLVGVSGCNSAGQIYGDYDVYYTDCCVEDGTHELLCSDVYGDGWNGAFMEIDGNVYCQNFDSGFEERVDIQFGGTVTGPPTGQTSPAPTSSPIVTPNPTTSTPAPSPSPSRSPVAPPTTIPPVDCTTYTLELHTVEWAVEISWELVGVDGCNSDGQTYEDGTIYSMDCCVPDGTHELACLDAYGDGWHLGSIQVNGNTYCQDFESGSEMRVDIEFGTSPMTPAPSPGPTRSPVAPPTEPPVTSCTMHKVSLFTMLYANQISWALHGVDGCSSTEVYGNNGLYEFDCCIPDSTFTLSCNSSWEDGWHNAYLEIEGHKFCDNFDFGYSQSVPVTFPMDPIVGCRDQAPEHVCSLIQGRGWCDHVDSAAICQQTCQQCSL